MMPLLLIMTRHLLAQKENKKHQTPEMMQASDIKKREGWEESKPLMHGYNSQIHNKDVIHCYDGPLQYTMTEDNPDGMTSIQVVTSLSRSKDDLISVQTNLDCCTVVDLEEEDDESTPVVASDTEKSKTQEDVSHTTLTVTGPETAILSPQEKNSPHALVCLYFINRFSVL
ncbi:uncharacterized protein LOC143238234 isoform X2 [Tachypleus tridentatus]|uniref:uncharacterized protein LOC143238234 isoform X2 n=1 Tax=Tachypleus tridentatus TaxID=6853 RepID=UPI003FD03CAD